jgi:hypothetical protein
MCPGDGHRPRRVSILKPSDSQPQTHKGMVHAGGYLIKRRDMASMALCAVRVRAGVLADPVVVWADRHNENDDEVELA